MKRMQPEDEQPADAVKGATRPMYRRIADDLLEAIRDGRFPVGTLLPGELDLIDRYSSSRHTVREALRVLEDMGIVRRERGRGTLVISPVARPAFVQMVRSPSELLSYPTDSSFRVIAESSVSLDQALAKRLISKSGSEWALISGLRTFENGTPVCCSDIYVLPQYAGIARALGASSRPVYDLIATTFGEEVEKINVEIYASVLSGHRARALNTPDGTPSLCLCRRYVGNGGRVFEISVSEHPAENFSYSLEFNRGWQAAEHWSWSK